MVGLIASQRILAYTLNSVTGEISKVFFLAVGLVIAGHAILTPMLMVITNAIVQSSTISTSTWPNIRCRLGLAAVRPPQFQFPK